MGNNSTARSRHRSDLYVDIIATTQNNCSLLQDWRHGAGMNITAAVENTVRGTQVRFTSAAQRNSRSPFYFVFPEEMYLHSRHLNAIHYCYLHGRASGGQKLSSALRNTIYTSMVGGHFSPFIGEQDYSYLGNEKSKIQLYNDSSNWYWRLRFHWAWWTIKPTCFALDAQLTALSDFKNNKWDRFHKI